MAEENVLIETNIFTDIINEIQDTASDCVLSEGPLGSTNVWEHTDVGNKMNAILKRVYEASDIYRAETSSSLPVSFLKVRDSMVNEDNAVSKNLKVNIISGEAL